MTVAGGHGCGGEANQFYWTHGLFVSDDRTVYVADYNNHLIMAWKVGATAGEVVAGGNGQGDRSNQLNDTTDIFIDRKTDSLLICDKKNRRVIHEPLKCCSLCKFEIFIDNIDCWGLTMDD